MLAALGPGVIFMALAQGSGELIWWPYIIAKYEACLCISTAARVPAPISRHLRNWALHGAHRRKHIPRFYPS
jgi:hypothetical protein